MSASARPREESQAADPPSRSKKWIKVGVALGLVAAASQITARMIVTGAIVWWLVSDRLLGMLAGWAIAKTPKKFQWTIRSIVIRPSPRRIFTSLFGSNPENARDAWSEIIVQGWQWHSPDSFVNGPNMLEIDRLTIRLELFSVYRAIAYKEAIQIDLMQLEGVRFNAHRNAYGLCNLWEALDLPDSDVNIRAYATNAAASQESASKAPVQVEALPALSTPATRGAAFNARGRRESTEFVPQGMRMNASDERGRADSAARQRMARRDTRIGDPRRRPRWGVRRRFNVSRLVVVDVELDVLDLLMPMAANKWGVHGAAGVKDAQAAGVTAANPAGPSMAEVIGARQSAEAKAAARARAAELSRLSVPVLRLDRARLEAGDERKAGSEDGVHGIYLGELVWALIGEVVRKITKKQPSKLLYNATYATFKDLSDMGTRSVASVLEVALNASSHLHHASSSSDMSGSSGSVSRLSGGYHASSARHANCCVLRVHLHSGKGMTRGGHRVSVRAHLALHDERNLLETEDGDLGALIDSAETGVKLWTRAPVWKFVAKLGPVRQIEGGVLRISLYHRVKNGMSPGGEVRIPLETVLTKDEVIDDSSKDGLVGYFPIVEADAGSNITGQLKLGLKLIRPELLNDADDAQNEGDEDNGRVVI